ncbi:hypothetical protein [Klebsiella sp. BIGb0407]|uniref:hypothetical protein n=1 Tax=Klebsiella sp. BIGb0407 TaxID=2940603 RepID=UPI002168A0F4|nr:hypothetical protein [Klebsiella sp. BIGb0407]MCS3430020.1 hypothetical protein [Klebsiella sp. BIGb0407]
MNFTYDISQDEMFLINGDDTKSPNRNLIREMVRQERNYIERVTSSGGNVYQAELDVNDAFVNILTSITDLTDRDLFSGIHLQEQMAAINYEADLREEEFNKEIAKQERGQKDEDEHKNNSSSSVLVVVVIAVIAVISFIAASIPW